MQRIKITWARAAVGVLVAVLLSGCGTDSGGGTGVSASCVRFDVQTGESATYRFTDPVAGATTLVKISVASRNGSVVTMDVEQGGTTSRLDYNTACEEGGNAGLSMTREVSHILFGSYLSLQNRAPPPAGEPVPVAPPPISTASAQCGPATVTTTAGTFAAKRCTTVYGPGDLYRTAEEYSIDERPQPFWGWVKETIEYSDGSRRDVELLQWNGL